MGNLQKRSSRELTLVSVIGLRPLLEKHNLTNGYGDVDGGAPSNDAD
jgi:hypothetical protein